MQISELWENPPKLHKALYKPGEEAINWGFTKAILQWLEANVQPGMNVLETGSGCSTIACILKGAAVSSIDPSPVTPKRIAEYAAKNGVALGDWTSYNVRSEARLPQLVTLGETFDICILDGSHTFPTPFVDFFYMSQLVKVGGLMFVDDAWKLDVCRFLKQWMDRMPEWDSVERVTRGHVFRKTAEVEHPDRFFVDPTFKINWGDAK